MNTLVKVLIDDDGEKIDDPVWHLAVTECSDPMVFCDGEFFGYGSSEVVFETKQVARGGITCVDCLEKIKTIKSVRL